MQVRLCLAPSLQKRHAANMRQLADDFYNGRSGRGKPLNDVIAPANVSFETFLYVSALVRPHVCRALIDQFCRGALRTVA